MTWQISESYELSEIENLDRDIILETRYVPVMRVFHKREEIFMQLHCRDEEQDIMRDLSACGSKSSNACLYLYHSS